MFTCPKCGIETPKLIGMNGEVGCPNCIENSFRSRTDLHQKYTLPSGKKITKAEKRHILDRGLSSDGKTVIHKSNKSEWKW